MVVATAAANRAAILLCDLVKGPIRIVSPTCSSAMVNAGHRWNVHLPLRANRPVRIACWSRVAHSRQASKDISAARPTESWPRPKLCAGDGPRNKLSDRYPWKSQTFPQIPNTFPKLPTLAMATRAIAWPGRRQCPDCGCNSFCSLESVIRSTVLLSSRVQGLLLGKWLRFEHSQPVETSDFNRCVAEANSLTHFSGRTRMERLDRLQR
jgi:hypothetical protein